MNKTTKRGFVMTGGGAKGLYEAGVINAFHLCGMEFDVITGSSIGAINSVFYAEYLYAKKLKQEAGEIGDDPLDTVEKMDPLVRAFLHAWWDLPTFGIINDKEDGPLGKLVKDLQRFDVSLPQITRLAWWYTDPQHSFDNSTHVWPDITRLVWEAFERLKDGQEFIRRYQAVPKKDRSLVEIALRTYLAKFGIEDALVPNEDAGKLREVFTQPTTPLQSGHLDGRKVDEEPALRVVDADRTLRDYAQKDIEVRLTRTNYRTGRLETSTHYTAKQFVDYMFRHAFRWRKGKRAVALGSERLQVIGNPGAVNAALASGRFPGVFSPMPIKDIYGFEERPDDEENKLLQHLLANWLNDDKLKEALFAAHGDAEGLQASYEFWQSSEEMWQIFPQEGDLYVDGGTIDNTPANSAIDGVKEWAISKEIDMGGLRLDLYTVFLHPAPDPGHVKLDPLPASYQVVQRTLQVQSAAKLASDAVNVRAINTFGRRGAKLNNMARELMEGLQELDAHLKEDMKEILDKDQLQALESAVTKRLEDSVKRAAGRPKDKRHDLAENLTRIQDILQEHFHSDLPLEVEPIEIYPDEMPMDTLQFTERLGYRKENAIRMMTVGCYNTLWTLQQHLEQKSNRDSIDNQVLAMANKWMGFEDLPEDAPKKSDSWRCQRKSCLFYDKHCPKGAEN